MSQAVPAIRPASAPIPLVASGAEAPFLTHVERHLGRLTLVAPDNHGRSRRPEKRRKGSKYSVPVEIVDAVARAGLPVTPGSVQPLSAASASQVSLIASSHDGSRAPSPSSTQSPRARRRRPGRATPNASNLSLPLISRDVSQVSAVSVTEGNVEMQDQQPELPVAEEPVNASRRIDIWAGIAEIVEEPPPAWTAPPRSQVPHSPPPTYRSPTPPSRSSSPGTDTGTVTEAQQKWEADRIAGFSLTERLQRERNRRRESLLAVQVSMTSATSSASLSAPITEAKEVYVPVTLLMAPVAIREEPESIREEPESTGGEPEEPAEQVQQERPMTPLNVALPASPRTPPQASPSLARSIQGSSPFPSPISEVPPSSDASEVPSLKARLLASPPSNKVIDRPRPFLRQRKSSSLDLQLRAGPSQSMETVESVSSPKRVSEIGRQASVEMSEVSGPVRSPTSPVAREPTPALLPAAVIIQDPPEASVVPDARGPAVTEPDVTPPVSAAPVVVAEQSAPAVVEATRPAESSRATQRPAPPKPILPRAPAPLFSGRSATSASQLFQSHFTVPPKVAPNLPSEQWRTADQLEAEETIRVVPSWEQKWEKQEQEDEWDEDTPLAGPSLRPYDPEARRRREGHRASLILARPISVRRKPPPVPPPRRSWVPPIVIPEEESLSSRSADESSTLTLPARPMPSSLAYISPREAAALAPPIAPVPVQYSAPTIIDRFEAASRRRPPPPPLLSSASTETTQQISPPIDSNVLPPMKLARSLPQAPTRQPPAPPRFPDHILRQTALGIRSPTGRPLPILPGEGPSFEALVAHVEGSGSESPPRTASAPPQPRSIEQEVSEVPLSQWTDLDILAARHTADPEPDEETPAESHYEPLLLLGEVLGPAPPRPTDEERARVSQALIEVTRRRVRSDGKVMLRMSCCGINVSRCAICQVQYRDQDPAAIFPGCLHVFHLACLESWLNRSRVCPSCRRDVSDET